eukprot:TRINITY_DN3078_c0_g1_i8.p1 TRINITY_DN3078_c0_g1~~TRINITY_DN3078_c0_g1_i8.p1  ORF type:complete len:264 (-),score=81.14 TRINITY_DN3078_c0_g1_i8:162-932(-)
MIRRPPRSTQSRSSAASDVYKRQRNHRIYPKEPIRYSLNYLMLSESRGFSKTQQREIEEMICQAIGNFNSKYYQELALLRSLFIIPKVQEEIKGIRIACQKPSVTQTPNTTEATPKPTSASPKIPEHASKKNQAVAKSPVNKNTETKENLRKIAAAVTAELKPRSAQIKPSPKVNRAYKTTRNVEHISRTAANAENSNDKLDLAGEASIDNILPNPFEDPLEDPKTEVTSKSPKKQLTKKQPMKGINLYKSLKKAN